MDKLSRERTLELLAAEPMDQNGVGGCWNIQAACKINKNKPSQVCAACYYGGWYKDKESAGSIVCGFEAFMKVEDAAMKSLDNIHEYAVKLYKRIKIMEIIDEKE